MANDYGKTIFSNATNGMSPDAGNAHILLNPSVPSFKKAAALSVLHKFLGRNPSNEQTSKVKIEIVPNPLLGANRGKAFALHVHAERIKMRKQSPIINSDDDRLSELYKSAAEETEQESKNGTPRRVSMSRKNRRWKILQYKK